MPAIQKYRAIVAHCDPDEQRRISRLLEETKLFEVILTTHNGEECVRQAVRRQPDIVIAETVLSGIDGLEVLRQLKARCSGIKVLLLTSYGALMTSRMAMAEADYTILAPYTDTVVVNRSIEVVRATEDVFPIQLVNNSIAATLAKLNAPRRLKGYPYVNDGIQLSVYDPNVIHCHAGPNGLYAQLCRRHNETYRNIERCMRSVSDHIFTHSSLAVLERYFTPADLRRGRITNITLISTLAAYVTDELRAIHGQDALSR